MATKKTKDLVGKIKDYLNNKYGAISPEWELCLGLLEDNIELYQKCQVSVNTYGLYDASTGKKNPLLTTMKDLQATILKEIQHLGLTPYAASKIKDAIEDDTDDFIDDLTNE